MPTSYSETTLNIQVNRYWLAMKEEFEPIERMGKIHNWSESKPRIARTIISRILVLIYENYKE